MSRRIALNAGWTLEGAGFTLRDVSLPMRVCEVLKKENIVSGNDTGLAPMECEWVYRRTWTLARHIQVESWEEERTYLTLPRVYGQGAIFIDEKHVADLSPNGQDVNVTSQIQAGSFTVQLVFSLDDRADGPLALGVDEGACIRGVSLLHITDINVMAGKLPLRAQLSLDVFMPGVYTFRYAFLQGEEALGDLSVDEMLAAIDTQIEHMLDIENALNWHPALANEPLMIRLQVLRKGQGCDTALVYTGIRTLQSDHPSISQPACLARVNGESVQLFGAHYRAQLAGTLGGKQAQALCAQAQCAGMNAFYVIGQAQSTFYTACDAAGLLVYQELPLDLYEAKSLIRTVGEHPCVVQWACAKLETAPNRPADRTHPVISALEEMIKRFDDDRPFTGTTPAGRMSTAPISELGRGTLLHALGPSYPLGPELMARYFNEDDAAYRSMLLPALLRHRELERVSGGYPFWPEGGALWAQRGGIRPCIDEEALCDFLGESELPGSQAICALTRHLQAESVRYALEQARYSGAFGFFAGRLGETTSNLSDDVLVEASGDPRPAYYAFAHAMKPVHVFARLDRTGYWADTHFDAFVRIVCDVPYSSSAQIHAVLYRTDGSELVSKWFDCTLETGEYGLISALLPDQPGILLLRLTLSAAGEVLDTYDQAICVGLRGALWPLAHPARTRLQLTEGMLVNSGDAVAFSLSVPGQTWRALLPGECVPHGGDIGQVELLNDLLLTD